jgi:hypothetical protein
MRRVRKLSPVKDNNFGGYEAMIWSTEFWNYKIFGISLVVNRSDYCPGIIYCFDEYYDRIGNWTRNRRSESFRAKKTTIAIQFFL